MEKRVMIRECVTRVGEHRKIPNKRTIGIYVDDDIPKKFRPAIIYHEKTEDNLQRKHGLSYSEAHRIATQKEKEKYFKNKPAQWKEYNGIVGAIFKENKK